MENNFVITTGDPWGVPSTDIFETDDLNIVVV